MTVYANLQGMKDTIAMPLESGLAGEATKTEGVLNISDCYANANFDRSTDQKTGFRTQSMIACAVRNSEVRRCSSSSELTERKGSSSSSELMERKGSSSSSELMERKGSSSSSELMERSSLSSSMREQPP
jgi:hypothetical protein